MIKPRILCIVQLPPPVHGVSVMNEAIISSQLINDAYLLDVINLQFVDSFSKLSKFSFKKIFKSFIYGYRIVKQVISNRPSLVYFTLVPTGFAFYRDALYISLLKVFGLKTLIHLHGKGIKANTLNSKLKRRLYEFVFSKAEVICLSQILVDDIKDIYHKRPFIVPNGIVSHTGPLPDAKEIINKQSKKVRILYLSNFVKSKGLLILIEALGLVKKKGYEFEARFAGEPFDLTHTIIKAQISRLGLDSEVAIMKPLSGEAKKAAYENADLFIFPTSFDAFPLVLLEAMQFGLPVISTVEGAIPEIVLNGETGFLVEKENPEQLAQKIELLLNDPSLREAMGKKGRERFQKKYTIGAFEKNICAVFQTILDGAKAQKPPRPMAINKHQEQFG